MNKNEAIDFMINEVERIEHERLAENMSIDPNKQKKAAVDNILKSLNSIKFTESELE